MREQARRFGTKVKFEAGDRGRPRRSARSPSAPTRTTYRTDALIVATGASAKLGGIPGEQELMGYGVSACATCDGFFFRGKEIVVIGGGDSAMEEATYLTKFASKVTVIHRRARAAGLEDHAGPRLRQPEDRLDLEHASSPRSSARREGGVTGVKLHNKRDRRSRASTRPQGVFYAIGHKPNTDLFQRQAGDERRRLHQGPGADHPDQRARASSPRATPMDPIYRQAITAAGTGCRAAIDAERWLQELHD